MPHLRFPISPSGPLINLGVCVSASRSEALKAAKQPVPSPILVQGLIDTGASGVCIDPSIVKTLSLQQSGIVDVHTPSTGGVPVKAAQYDISITLHHPGVSLNIHTVPAIESMLSNQGFLVLIGRDILKECLLIYDGASGQCTIAF